MRLRSPLYLQNLTFFQQSTFLFMSHPNKSTVLPLFPPMDRNLVSALYIDRRVIGRWTRFQRRVFFFFFFPSGNRNLRIKWDNERRKRRNQERRRRSIHDGMFPAGHPSSCQPRPAGLNMSGTLRALSICQNCPAQPFWQWNRLFPRFFAENHLLPALYLGFTRSGWIVLINKEILITTRRVWLVSSDKWKEPWVSPLTSQNTLIRSQDMLVRSAFQFDFYRQNLAFPWNLRLNSCYTEANPQWIGSLLTDESK